MKQWQKLIREITRTPGPIRVQLFLLTTLTASSVLSTGLQIYNLASNTSEENILLKKENPKEEKEKLPQSQTGSDIMEALTILNEILEKLEKTLSEEKSSPSTQPLEK